jgi:hypothetical protein
MIALIIEVPYWYFVIEVEAKKVFELEQNEGLPNGKDVFTSIQNEGGTIGDNSRMKEIEEE